MGIEIKVLPAYCGDALLITYGTPAITILIDSGPRRFYTKGKLKQELENIEKIDLAIVTHVDEDHIGGLLKYYSDANSRRGVIKQCFFNSGRLLAQKFSDLSPSNYDVTLFDEAETKMSFSQGTTLEKQMQLDGILLEKVISANDTFKFGDAEILILSPVMKDLETLYKHWKMEVNDELLMAKSLDHDKSIEELIKNNHEEHGSKYMGYMPGGRPG